VERRRLVAKGERGMKVILIEDVDDLGRASQVVNVKDGFARNFLIPQKKALPATPENMRKMERMRTQIEAMQAKALSEAEGFAQKIGSISLTLARQAGENEKLFGSVTSLDIERALKEVGIEVERRKILLHDPIKQLGVFQVPIKLHPDVTAQVRVCVVQA
jgi:large subunit ribosomal protein L9